MIECLSLQHANQLYKEGKIGITLISALCTVYHEDEEGIGALSSTYLTDEQIEQFVSKYCKVEHLFMAYGGGNLFLAESSEDIVRFANDMLGAGFTSVAEEINNYDSSFVTDNPTQIFVFYATNNSGGPVLISSPEDWKKAGGEIPGFVYASNP